MKNTNQNLGTGTWTYRSLLNNPDISVDFDSLEFARANLTIVTHTDGSLTGTIGDNSGPVTDHWQLALTGSIQYGSPAALWFQGKGKGTDGTPWVYDYLCYIVPHIPNGINQMPALVGNVTRAVAHGTGSPAGVTASFYAVLQPETNK